MKKSILKLVGGVFFCLPLMFASCGNIDNPLEEITGGSSEGGGEQEETVFNLKAALAAIEDGATIEIAYTVLGNVAPEEEYKVKLVKDGDGFAIQEGSGFPTDLAYNLDGKLALDEDGKLIFTLTAEKKDNEGPLTRAVTQAGKVMVITFDPTTNTYDYVGTPGFTFKVLNVDDQEVTVENASPKTASMVIQYNNSTQILYKFNHNGEKWGDFEDKFKVLQNGEEYDPYYDFCIFREGDNMYVHIGYAYQFLYGESLAGNVNYTIKTDDGETDVNPDTDEIEDTGNYKAKRNY